MLDLIRLPEAGRGGARCGTTEPSPVDTVALATAALADRGLRSVGASRAAVLLAVGRHVDPEITLDETLSEPQAARAGGGSKLGV